ncbi:dynein associated protein-domain-containing protein [Chytriomyces sp. MP71]|nr:dynein associated protein-domain-containing protein [Chytriomyces sp. MP71]
MASAVTPNVGDHVEVLNSGVVAQGVVRFVGTTEFAAGVWVGIELDDGVGGKNDGSVADKRRRHWPGSWPSDLGVVPLGNGHGPGLTQPTFNRYFTCVPGAGVFMRTSQIRRVVPSAAAASGKSETPASASKPPLASKGVKTTSPSNASSTPSSSVSSRMASTSSATGPKSSVKPAASSAALRKPAGTTTPKVAGTKTALGSTGSSSASTPATSPQTKTLKSMPSTIGPPSIARTKTNTSTTSSTPSLASKRTGTPSQLAAPRPSPSPSDSLSRATPPLNTAEDSSVASSVSSSAAELQFVSASSIPLLGSVTGLEQDGRRAVSGANEASLVLEIESLRAEVKAAQDAKDDLLEQLRAFSIAKEELAAKLQESADATATLRRELSASLEKGLNLEDQLKAVEEEKEGLAGQLRVAEEKNSIVNGVASLTEEVEILRAKVAEYEQGKPVVVTKDDERVATLAEEVTELKLKLVEADTKFAAALSSNGDAERLDIAMDSLEEENKDLRRRLEEARDASFAAAVPLVVPVADTTERDQKIAELEQQVELLQTQLQDHKSTDKEIVSDNLSSASIEHSDSIVAALRKEVEELNIRLKVTEEANAAQVSENEKLRRGSMDVSASEIDDLEAKYKLQELAVTAADEKIVSLQEEVDNLQYQLKMGEDALVEMETNLKQLTDEKVAAANKQIEGLKADLKVAKAAEEKLIEANKQIDDLQGHLKAAQQAPKESLLPKPAASSNASLEQKVASLTEDLEGMRIRLKFAESKRSNDRDFSKDIDKLNLEVQSASIQRTTMAAKITSLQQELKNALNDKDMLEDQLVEANDALEMATLDKEYEAERAETLEAELQQLKDQVEELNTDLDFVVSKRPEVELSPEQFENTVTAMTLLENQNDRLKDALVQFRDFHIMREKHLDIEMKELHRRIDELEEQQLIDAGSYMQLMEAEVQIEEMKESLDSRKDAAALIEFLNNKNLELQAKIENLNDAVEDMEILVQLTDDLEENHVLLEKDLIEEIDVKDGIMNTMRTKINSQEETVADYERTIHQFRELVKQLQECVFVCTASSAYAPNDRDLSNNNTGAPTFVDPLPFAPAAPAVVGAELLEASGIKAQYKGIDIELRKLDADQANEHLDIVKIYLPETFFKTEHVPVLSLLLLRRIVFKTNMIKMFLEDNILVEKNAEHAAFISEMRHKLFWIMGLSRRLVSFLEGCSEEVFLQFSSTYTELIGTERKIDVIIELLKIEEVVGQRPVLVELQKCIGHLESLADLYLKKNSSNIDLQRQSLFYIEIVDSIGDRFDSEIHRLEDLFTVPETIWEPKYKEEVEQVKNEFLQTVPSISQHSKELRTMTRKIRRFINDIVEAGNTVSDEIVALLGQVHKNANMCIDYLSVVAGHVGQYVREQFDENQELSLPLMIQLASNASEAVLKTPDNLMGISLVILLTHTNAKIMDILETLEDPMNIDPLGDRNPAPWLARATKIKTDYVLNTDLTNQIESLKIDIRDLVTDLAEKKQLQVEYSLKVDKLEKKADLTKAQNAKIANLEARVQKLMENERAYTETVEVLQKEKEELQRDIEAYKQNALRFEKMTSPPTNRRVGGSAHPSPFKKAADGAVGQAVPPDGMVIDGDVAAQFESLKSALRFLRAENTKLKADIVAKASVTLFRPSDPLMRRGISNQKASANTSAAASGPRLTDVAQSVVSGLTRDTKNLLRDIHKVSATPAVVDISSKISEPGKWVSIQKDPLFQHQKRVEAVERLVMRGEDLQDAIKKASSQIEESTGKALLPKTTAPPVLLGRISVPKTYSDSSAKGYIQGDKCSLVLSSRKQWEALHGMFSR